MISAKAWEGSGAHGIKSIEFNDKRPTSTGATCHICKNYIGSIGWTEYHPVIDIETEWAGGPYEVTVWRCGPCHAKTFDWSATELLRWAIFVTKSLDPDRFTTGWTYKCDSPNCVDGIIANCPHGKVHPHTTCEHGNETEHIVISL